MWQRKRLFKAYFTEGKNIDDYETLLQLGVEIGLTAGEIEQMLKSDNYAKEVRQDEGMAQSLGVREVPFFVIDEKYEISGAQPVETFLNALGRAWRENEKFNQLTSPLETDGSTCTVNGNC